MKLIVTAALALLLPLAAGAQATGPVTGLPMPRFVSLKSASTNARRGPSLSHRVDWEFLRKGLPVQVTAEYENWRRVEDSEGAGGWVHYALLSGSRTVLVIAESAVLFQSPDDATTKVAVAKAGVVAGFDHCELGWCLLEIDNYEGWTQAENLWGIYTGELGD